MDRESPTYLATPVQLAAEAEVFTRTLSLGSTATLITLSGELGAGKTTFTQGIAAALGITEPVTSPTFVLEKIYSLASEYSPFTHLIHIDAYRLQSGKDLAALGYDELMKDKHNIIIIEWPERVADALPTPTAHITLEVSGEGRTITYG